MRDKSINVWVGGFQTFSLDCSIEQILFQIVLEMRIRDFVCISPYGTRLDPERQILAQDAAASQGIPHGDCDHDGEKQSAQGVLRCRKTPDSAWAIM